MKLSPCGRGVSRQFFALACLLLVAGCVAIRPLSPLGGTPRPAAATFHDDLDRVLQRFVDEQGLVDYPALAREHSDLDRYYWLLSQVSPDTRPDLFPTREGELCYWINAYNATVIQAVLQSYPIRSVGDVKPPFAFLLPARGGFFLQQRIVLGGHGTSLYYLEHAVIRKRFRDPRVHFALNCASLGCPHLPREAFRAEPLDQQLDREARRFLAEERNLRVDHRHRVVYLSSIFDWYRDDFVGWLAERFPKRNPALLDYVRLYVSPERARELDLARSYEIRFLKYDWRLNDQAGRPN